MGFYHRRTLPCGLAKEFPFLKLGQTLTHKPLSQCQWCPGISNVIPGHYKNNKVHSTFFSNTQSEWIGIGNSCQLDRF